jgi:hypothetical protein
MKVYLTKTRSGFHPLTEHDAEKLRSWPLGQTREVDAREKRNPQHHRKLFAILRTVCENSEDFETPEALLTAIKIKAGYVDLVRTLDGERVAQARSISFADMEQGDFDRFYETAVRLCGAYLGVDPTRLETEGFKNG